MHYYLGLGANQPVSILPFSGTLQGPTAQLCAPPFPQIQARQEQYTTCHVGG